MNTGMMFVMLTDSEDRDRSSFELARATREALNRIPGQVAEVLDMSRMMSGSMYDYSFKDFSSNSIRLRGLEHQP